MSQLGELVSAAGAWFYIIIALLLVFIVWWIYKTFISKKPIDKDLPQDSFEQLSQDIKEGRVKCILFRNIKGVKVADFTSIPAPIGEMYQLDPSCPIVGSGYIVKEDKKGEIVDYDPRQEEYKIDESPEFAWFATNWDIVNKVYYAPTQWWKSTTTWLAVFVLVIVLILGMTVMG